MLWHRLFSGRQGTNHFLRPIDGDHAFHNETHDPGADLQCGNERAANLVGISTNRTKFLALMISGAAAGLAGVIVSARLNAGNPTLGALDLLDAIGQ